MIDLKNVFYHLLGRLKHHFYFLFNQKSLFSIEKCKNIDESIQYLEDNIKNTSEQQMKWNTLKNGQIKKIDKSIFF